MTSAPSLAMRPVGAAMAALAALLTAFSNGYGFHRDELYFRMLDRAWGYVDQPPLTPLLARLFTTMLPDEPWALRIPATVAVVAAQLIVVLIAREVGGGRAAQTLAAWGFASAVMPMLFGHVLLTASLDLLVWPGVSLLIIRALLRQQPRWWWVAGAAVGLSTYNKLLVAMLLGALGIGLLVVGPRRALVSIPVLGATILAALIAAPNLIYQATHHWPQLTMGAALATNNADEVRVMMWPFLILMLGPPLVPVWIAGLVTLLRRSQWRPIRCFAVAFPLVVALTFAAGSQLYYPVGLLLVLFAVGCVPTADWLAGTRGRRTVMVAGLAVNAVVSATIALPLIPLSILGDTPVPGINQATRDSVGWPTYVEQISAVYFGLDAADRGSAAIITANYGEAGAIARYGQDQGLPWPYSGHNELYFAGRPADAVTTVILVGHFDDAPRVFATCTERGQLANGVGVDNEEEGSPITVCQRPTRSWAELWPSFQHFD